MEIRALLLKWFWIIKYQGRYFKIKKWYVGILWKDLIHCHRLKWDPWKTGALFPWRALKQCHGFPNCSHHWSGRNFQSTCLLLISKQERFLEWKQLDSWILLHQRSSCTLGCLQVICFLKFHLSIAVLVSCSSKIVDDCMSCTFSGLCKVHFSYLWEKLKNSEHFDLQVPDSEFATFKKMEHCHSILMTSYLLSAGYSG